MSRTIKAQSSILARLRARKQAKLGLSEEQSLQEQIDLDQPSLEESESQTNLSDQNLVTTQVAIDPVVETPPQININTDQTATPADSEKKLELEGSSNEQSSESEEKTKPEESSSENKETPASSENSESSENKPE